MLRLRMTRARFAAGVVAATALALLPNIASSQSKEPIKIGFGMSLTGPLAANGTQIFAEVRGQRLPLQVAAMPFVPNTYKR